MPKSVLISLDVFVLGFIISFFIAALIKVLMFFIRYAFDRSQRKVDHM